jgi:hypothetical protein
MNAFQQLAQNTLRTGGLASAATTLAAAVCGLIEDRNAVAPLNSVSHIAWGDRASRQERPSWKYTLTGLALNTAAVTSWAALYELFFGGAGAVQSGAANSNGKRSHASKASHSMSRVITRSLIGGAAISGLAYVTDYKLVPAWLTPGFEKRLSNRSLLGIYAALALGLGLGGLLSESSPPAASTSRAKRPAAKARPRATAYKPR